MSSSKKKSSYVTGQAVKVAIADCVSREYESQLRISNDVQHSLQAAITHASDLYQVEEKAVTKYFNKKRASSQAASFSSSQAASFSSLAVALNQSQNQSESTYPSSFMPGHVSFKSENTSHSSKRIRTADADDVDSPSPATTRCPLPVESGTFDVDNWPLYQKLIDVVGTRQFITYVKGKKLGAIGGKVVEAEFYTDPTVTSILLRQHSCRGDLDTYLKRPIHFSELMRDYDEHAWTDHDHVVFCGQFKEKMEELCPGQFLTNFLLLMSLENKSSQDVHIDVLKGASSLIASVNNDEVLATIAYDQFEQCTERRGLINCMDFLKEWHFKDDGPIVEFLKKTMTKHFDSLDVESEDGPQNRWELNECQEGVLLHDFKRRENAGTMKRGEYRLMREPTAHRAPTVTTARFSFFAVMVDIGSDYRYCYNDQVTAPELIAMVIEDLLQYLGLERDFDSYQQYTESMGYKAKVALLFVFARSLWRCNDLKTEKTRFEDSDYDVTKEIFNALMVPKRSVFKRAADVFDELETTLTERMATDLIKICDKYEKKRQDSTNSNM